MNNIYIYILIMALVTYLIRMLPLALIRKKITNKFFRSFLYYVPFVTLAVMTFPAMFMPNGDFSLAKAIAFAVSMGVAYFGGNLPVVATIACAVVFIAERFI